MNDLLAAIGLVFVIEGLVFAAFPGFVLRAMETALEMGESALRWSGIVSALIGVIMVWLVRSAGIF